MIDSYLSYLTEADGIQNRLWIAIKHAKKRGLVVTPKNKTSDDIIHMKRHVSLFNQLSRYDKTGEKMTSPVIKGVYCFLIKDQAKRLIRAFILLKGQKTVKV